MSRRKISEFPRLSEGVKNAKNYTLMFKVWTNNQPYVRCSKRLQIQAHPIMYQTIKCGALRKLLNPLSTTFSTTRLLSPPLVCSYYSEHDVRKRLVLRIHEDEHFGLSSIHSLLKMDVQSNLLHEYDCYRFRTGLRRCLEGKWRSLVRLKSFN